MPRKRIATRTDLGSSNGDELSTTDELAAQPPTNSADTPEKKPVDWQVFLRNASLQDVRDRIASEFGEIISHNGLATACWLVILDSGDSSIDSYDLDQIFSALTQANPNKDKDVVLVLLSRGGEAELAYQISKLCKSFARNKFVAVVPRHAKSAATLIAIGAEKFTWVRLGN
jgi:ClpP class serine protease